jgi:flagellar basal-body rod protein FlgB
MNHSNAILLIKALDGLSARSIATAENIANAATPGYRPLRVSFEDALKDTASRGDDAVKALTFRAQPEASGEVRVNLELATAATTAARYGALIDIFDRQMQLESVATKGDN